MIDMRGPFKHVSYPRAWTPLDIFIKWISAIGNENAARLRHVSFYMHNFAVHLNINPEASPNITTKFRQTRRGTESDYITAEAPVSLAFDQAIQRAKKRLAFVIDSTIAITKDRPLTSNDFVSLSEAINEIQPTLCTRNGLGWEGAIMSEDPSISPDVRRHLSSCCDCCDRRNA